MFKGFLVFFSFVFCNAIHERVLLKDVQVLTLRAGAFTTGRRNSPVQQLLCQNCNDDAARKAVDTIQCRNVGFDGRDVNWKCETELSKQYKLGRTEVSCEGFDSPEDPFILAGSCAVEYHLIHTPPSPQPQRQTLSPPTQARSNTTHDETDWMIIFLVLFMIFLCSLIVFASLESSSTLHHVGAAPVYHRPVAPPPVYYPGVYHVEPPQTVVHRHTTIVHEREPSPVRYYSSPPPPSAPERSPSPERHVSVSHATTKRR